MADISKIKLANGTTVTLKDAQGRTNMTTLLGGHGLEALGAAAWKAVAAEIGGTGLVEASTVKAYVDAQVATVPSFDVVVVADGADLPTASADTFHKIYLKKEGLSGTYAEYITYKNGDAYVWERIGVLDVDLSAYVKKTTKIAGIDLNDDITVAELKAALSLGAMAYADKGTATVASKTVSGVTGTATTSGSISVKLDQTKTEATLTKAAYKPAGSITGEAIKGGSIAVTLKDAAAKTEATISTSKFIPAGTIAAVEGGDFQALKSASFAADENGVEITGTISKPAINLTSTEKTVVTGLTGGSVASFKEGAFTPASFKAGFYTAGTAATWTGAAYTAPTLGDATTAKFASDGLVASIDEADTEMLVFSAATKADAVTAQGDFNAGNVNFGTFNGGSATVIDTTKFSGGSKAADTFTANELQGVSTAAVNNVTAAALANAPVFTGDKYKVTTTADTALKTVSFTATNSADIVNKVEYVKQDINSAEFTPVAATLGFAGTEVADLIPTKVEYNVASVNAEGTKFTGSEIAVAVGDIVVPEQTIEVSPVAKA